MFRRKQGLLGFIILAMYVITFYPVIAATSVAFVAATFDRQEIKFYQPDTYNPYQQVLELVAWTEVREKVSFQFWMNDPDTGVHDPTMQMYVMYNGNPYKHEMHRYKSILDFPDFLQVWTRVLLWREARFFWSTLAQ